MRPRGRGTAPGQAGIGCRGWGGFGWHLWPGILGDGHSDATGPLKPFVGSRREFADPAFGQLKLFRSDVPDLFKCIQDAISPG